MTSRMNRLRPGWIRAKKLGERGFVVVGVAQSEQVILGRFVEIAEMFVPAGDASYNQEHA